MRSSSTSLRSLVMPYRYPISRMRSSSPGSIEGRPVSLELSFKTLPHELETDVLVDQSQQMGLRNLVFQAEIVEQRFRVVVLSHHDQQASDDGNPAKHESF